MYCNISERDAQYDKPCKTFLGAFAFSIAIWLLFSVSFGRSIWPEATAKREEANGIQEETASGIMGEITVFHSERTMSV